MYYVFRCLLVKLSWPGQDTTKWPYVLRVDASWHPLYHVKVGSSRYSRTTWANALA